MRSGRRSRVHFDLRRFRFANRPLAVADLDPHRVTERRDRDDAHVDPGHEPHLEQAAPERARARDRPHLDRTPQWGARERRRRHAPRVPLLKIVFKLEVWDTPAWPGSVSNESRVPEAGCYSGLRDGVFADLTAQPGVRTYQGHLLAARHHLALPRQSRGDRGVRPRHSLGDHGHQDPGGRALAALVPAACAPREVLAREHLCARQLPLPVLRQEGRDRGPHVRPRPTALARRADRVDEHRLVLLPVQPQEGRPHASRSEHEVARAAHPAELGPGRRHSRVAALRPRGLARLPVLDRRPRQRRRVTRIVFVCLGNICRSPTAEGVMRHLAERAGRSHELTLDSAGTGDWHIGEPPDPRTARAAKQRGYDLSKLRARQFTRKDFGDFDLVLAMDRSNLANIEHLAKNLVHVPPIKLFRSFDPSAPHGAEVPDPYSGGAQGFEDVLDICERACEGLLRWVLRWGR